MGSLFAVPPPLASPFRFYCALSVRFQGAVRTTFLPFPHAHAHACPHKTDCFETRPGADWGDHMSCSAQ